MLKKYKPVTPGQRHKIRLIKVRKIDREEYKQYVREGRIGKRKASTAGRNQTGRITVRGRGGAEKRRSRLIDHKRQQGHYSEAIVSQIQYNPSITAQIAILQINNSKRWVIIAPEGIEEGQKIVGQKLVGNSIKTYNIGEARPIIEISLGLAVHNIDGKYVRSAGTQAIVQRRWQDKKGQWYSEVLMPSGLKKSFKAETLVTIGQVSNINHQNQIYGKAGSRRRMGIRPIVRGEARNPIDHPHGGKSHGSGGKGNAARNVWGRLAKWISSGPKK